MEGSGGAAFFSSSRFPGRPQSLAKASISGMLGPGDCFGEIALTTAAPASATSDSLATDLGLLRLTFWSSARWSKGNAPSDRKLPLQALSEGRCARRRTRDRPHRIQLLTH